MSGYNLDGVLLQKTETMAKRLVRQFKTQSAPADARGYQPQARFIYPEAPAPVQETVVINPTLPVVDLSNTPPANVLYAEDTRLFPPVETTQPPRTMGTPAMPPDWYPETPHRIWSPDATTGTRRNTGADDIYDIPPVQRPTITTTNTPISGGGIFPQTDPQIVEATLTPNVGVDTTAETYTLPPQQQIIYERPPVVDYGPITTPIERPIQEDIGYIDPHQPYTLTPGPQIAATETSLFEPQPIQSAYAAPIQVDYPQPQTQPPVDIPQDDVTALVDTILPEIETTAPKTLDLYQEGPQWVEDPQAAAAQELLDQAGFTQTDPSIYSPAETLETIEGPEIAFPEPIDYTQSYGDPVAQEVYPGTDLPLPNYDRGVPQPVQRPSITQPPEIGAPIIPTSPVTDTAKGFVAGTTTTTDNLPPAGGPNDLIFKNQEGILVINPEGHTTGPHGFVKPPVGEVVAGEDEQATVDAETISTDETLSKVDTDGTVTGGVQADEEDTSYPGVDAGETLPVGRTLFPDVDTGEDEGGRGTMTVQEQADIKQPPQQPQIPSHREPTLGGQAAPDPTVTQPPVGGRKWLHTGPQDFAETRWQLFGAAQGDPIITHTPAVSGPQVNPQTGEITTKPLTWWQNRPAGSSVSPYTKGISTSTPTDGETKPGGSLGGGLTHDEVAQIAGGSITPVLDQLHPGATNDGQTVTFSEIGNYDDWVDGVLDLEPTLKGIDDLGYEKRDAEGNRVGWGNHALDGFNKLAGTFNDVFNFMGDPSKPGKEFTAAILEDFGMKPTEGNNLKELASNLNKFRNEFGQMWETGKGDKAWGRKWNDLTQTQEYGNLQPAGIFALLTNPPAALAMTANSLLYDIKNAVVGMFSDNPDYSGNMAQDVLNGAFHFLGKAAKSVGSAFGKIGQKLTGLGSDKKNFTDKDLKLDPMEVSRRLLFASKNENPAVGDVRYELVKTLLENGVDVRFHNNAVTFDKGIANARIEHIKTVIDELGLSASNLEIMAGTEGLDDFPELKWFLEELAKQKRAMGQS